MKTVSRNFYQPAVGEAPLIFAINDISKVGAARRAGLSFAETLSFSDTTVGRTAIIITEAGNNIIRHARTGWLLIQSVRDGLQVGIEIIAIDKGPGMSDVAKCLRDGYSTTGTPGTGLRAIRRLSNYFDLYSATGKGTILISRVFNSSTGPASPLAIGGVSVPIQGEEECGDAWVFFEDSRKKIILMADGLGHGPAAAMAARVAMRTFLKQAHLPPSEILMLMHEELRATRGAAVAIAELPKSIREVRFAGVGNISACVLEGPHSRNFASHNGTLGREIRRVQEFIYPYSEAAVLVFHSDGILSRWDLSSYPGVLRRSPALISALLFRDFSRGRDDATVVTCKPCVQGEP